MERSSGITLSIIDELHSWDIYGDQIEGESMVLREVLLMHLILAISSDIKWNAQVVLLEASLMNFFLRICNEIKWKVKVVLLEESLMNFIL